MDFVNSDYLRSGFQFVKLESNNTLNYKGRYRRLENFYNMGLKNMTPATSLFHSQNNPPMSLDTKKLKNDKI